MIDLLTVPEEQEIADGVAGFLREHFPVERHRGRGSAGKGGDLNRWDEFVGMGGFGLALPESVGGIGLSVAEEILAFREYGRHLVTPAILGTVLAARIALSAGEDNLARSLIEGGRRAGLAHPVASVAGPELSGDYQLFDATHGDLVVAWSDDGAGIYPTAAFTEKRVAIGLDQSVTVEVARADRLPAMHWVKADDDANPLLATVLSAAMLVGITEAARDMAVAYAKERVQFGRPIGAFQAIKHKCADMALNAEAAWCETVYAALALRAGHADAAFHAMNAKMLAATAALAAAKENVQVHGGMGYTAEVDAHLFVKRAHVLTEIGGAVRRMQQKVLSLPLGE